MVDEPAEIPVTTPVVLTVATAGNELLHVPPAVASARAVVLPAHTAGVPVIAATVFTVSTTVETQPVGSK